MNHPKLLFLGLSAVMLLTAAGCTQKTSATPPDLTVTVEVATVQPDTLHFDSTYVGTISSEGTASVVTMVSGNVEEVYVSVGDAVNVGSPLCRFDDESARLSLRNAQANQHSAQSSLDSAQGSYRGAQSNLDSVQGNYHSMAANYGGETLSLLEEQVRMAQENYNAFLSLYELGAVSRLEVEQAEQSLHSAQAGLEAAQAGLDSAKAGLEAAQASLDSARAGLGTAQAGVQSAAVNVASAEYQLSLYHLTAPVSGIVEAVHVSANNFASSGTTAFVISNAKNKTVTFYVTDGVRKNITVGQPVEISVQNMRYSGSISEIGGIVDAATGMFQVKAMIEEAQDLPDGLAVSVTTASNTVENTILVPSDALYFDSGAAYVYRMENGTATRVDLKSEVLLYTREWTAVPFGLEAGDEIIISWSATLKDGAPVQVSGQERQGGEAE